MFLGFVGNVPIFSMAMNIIGDLMDDSNLSEELQEVIIFLVGGEKFATRIQDVQEIIEPAPIKKVANSRDHFLGVVTLREEIIGVVDLAMKMGFTSSDYDSSRLVVFSTPEGVLSCISERIVKVQTLKADAVNYNPPLKSNISKDFLVGMFEEDGEIISLLDFNKILANDDVIDLSDLQNNSLEKAG